MEQAIIKATNKCLILFIYDVSQRELLFLKAILLYVLDFLLIFQEGCIHLSACDILIDKFCVISFKLIFDKNKPITDGIRVSVSVKRK